MSSTPTAFGAALTAVFGAIFLSGCHDPVEPAADAGADVDADQASPVIGATDENNYSIVGTIDIPSVATASATDLNLCWDGLLRDIQCHGLDPVDDIDNIGLIRFGHLTQQEVETRMSAGDLQQADIDGYLELRPTGELCSTLSAFSFFGTPVDVASQYVAGDGTYLLVLTTGTTPGVGARMLMFLEPDEGSANTTVDVGEGCGVVTVDAALSGATPLSVPRIGPWRLDWSALTTDGQGNPLQTGRIDGLSVAYYADTTVAELEQQILDLLLVATWLWSADSVSGHTFDFEEGRGGQVGFDTYSGDAGVWLLALTCSRCYTPAPIFLAVLEPGEP